VKGEEAAWLGFREHWPRNTVKTGDIKGLNIPNLRSASRVLNIC
jgi:hypothetical protein